MFKKYIQNYSNLLLSKENLFKFIDNCIHLDPQNSKLRIKDNEFSIPENFNIINEEILKSMKEFQSISNKNINEEKIEKMSFFINDGKIIVNYPQLQFLLIIGKENKNKNILIPEKFLNFESKKQKSFFFFIFNVKSVEEILNDQLIDFLYNEKNEIFK